MLQKHVGDDRGLGHGLGQNHANVTETMEKRGKNLTPGPGQGPGLGDVVVIIKIIRVHHLRLITTGAVTGNTRNWIMNHKGMEKDLYKKRKGQRLGCLTSQVILLILIEIILLCTQ